MGFKLFAVGEGKGKAPVGLGATYKNGDWEEECFGRNHCEKLCSVINAVNVGGSCSVGRIEYGLHTLGDTENV